MQTRTFDLGTVLSITTGKLLSNIDNVYEILDYMTGDSLFTHQLPRASRECEPIILRQYPQLKDIDANSVNTENWKEFLDEQVSKYGNSFEIIPVGLFEHKFIDPITEAIDMMGGEDKVIPIIY